MKNNKSFKKYFRVNNKTNILDRTMLIYNVKNFVKKILQSYFSVFSVNLVQFYFILLIYGIYIETTALNSEFNFF